jgi:hypothetical protein
MNEEEAFWCLVQLVETILPLDYFSNMVGLMIDQQVLKEIVKISMPNLWKHMEENNFDPSLMAFQWFVGFFTNNLPEEVS